MTASLLEKALPGLSIIVASRNDSYFADLSRRQALAHRVLMDQLERWRIRSEVIVVDWNAPADRPPLAELFSGPDRREFVSCRVITVPAECHRRYRHGHAWAMHAAAAWNVGLRRARGRFLLPKSADTFYSSALYKNLSGPLDSTQVYRCDRVDVDPGLLDIAHDPARFEAACAQAFLHRYGRPAAPPAPDLANLHTDACGDFLLMSREAWETIGGFEEACGVITPDVDGIALHAAVHSNYTETVLGADACVYKPAHGGGVNRRVKREFEHRWLWRHLWLLASGAPAEARLADRIATDYPRRRIHGITTPSYSTNFIGRVRQWHTAGASCRVNGRAWGLSDDHLAETRICRASWEQDS